MNWKTTWALLGVAVLMFAFIMLVERRISTETPPPVRLLAFKATEVTNIQVRLTNQLVLRVERATAESPWVLTVPISYPAQQHAIESLLRELEVVVPQTGISQRELKAGKRTEAEFGLDVPQATLTLQHNGRRTEILYGSKTTVGDGVYAQVLSQPGIFVVEGHLRDRLPRSHDDWRDTAFLSSPGFTRMEVRASGRGFSVEVDTNRTLVLTKPTYARADPAKLEALWRNLFTTQISGFVTDNPRVDLEQYGLLPPAAELLFFSGTNEQLVVQFGKSPFNDSTNVYARRLAQTNIVLVPKAILEALQVSPSEVRDLHLVSFSPDAVDAVEVIEGESFSVRRQTNGTWMITEPRPELADLSTVREWLYALARLEGTVEKDVVTDFASPYGLNPPARKYLLKASGTNGNSSLSNRVTAELHLGSVRDKKVFARRPDEATVYSVPVSEVAKLPYASWQLRDREVWRFTTNQIHRVTVRHHGQTRTLQRSAGASWSIVEGAGIVSSSNAALEETMYRLGQLRANYWVDKGADRRASFGLTETGDKITIELLNGEKPQVLVLEFGEPGYSPTQLPYALAVVNGQAWIFEFPPALWFSILRDLLQPLAVPPQ
jgi:hypothetical protein